jgi:hypothetical protein
VGDIKFETFKAACDYFNVTRSKVISRLERHWSLEEAFEVKSRPTRKQYKSRKYKVYKIVNKVSSKVYIGATYRSLKIRLSQHLAYPTPKLKKDIILYGKNCFKIYLILECDESKICEKESKYIIKYNALKEGYNTMSGNYGGIYSNGKRVFHKGKRYNSVTELAEHLGISRHVVSYRLNLGKTDDEVACRTSLKISGRPAAEITYAGKNYKSAAQLASFLKMDKNLIRSRIKAGKSDAEIISKTPLKNPGRASESLIYKRKKWTTASLAKYLDISIQATRHRVSRQPEIYFRVK